MLSPTNRAIEIDLQVASTEKGIPTSDDIERWVSTTLNHPQVQCILASIEVSVRIADKPESQRLNREYRQQDKPTNVLSFPAELPEELALPLLGDLVICAPVVREEAIAQQKELTAHWAHMVIHGTLHLLGYDHIEDEDAEQMESLETTIVQLLGFSAPYESIDHLADN